MSHDCRHHARTLAGAPPTAQRLARAQARCLAAGGRWTAPRARTYELLLGADGPVRAYDLVAGFGPSRVAAKPATVYRALDYLLELGLAHRLESRNLFVACAAPGAPHYPQILICDCCARAFELELGAGWMIERAADEHGYALTGWLTEATGPCPACH